jgi:hypothetical protein
LEGQVAAIPTPYPVTVLPIAVPSHVTLSSDAGIHIDCGHIVSEFFLNIPSANVITGYVVVTSPRELDVTAAYTAVFVSSGPPT